MKPHKHAAVIKAWADGATVQFMNLSTNRIWMPMVEPRWYNDTDYRASIADVEGKPVFAGDKFWNNGALHTAEAFDGTYLQCTQGGLHLPYKCSWNPPKPKTITVTIPMPTEISYSGGCAFIYYRTEEMGIDALNTYRKIKEAMK